MQSRVTPRPLDDALFLHGLLEGIAAIEAACYHALQSHGAPAINRIFTAGGGAKNTVWTEIRQLAIPETFGNALHAEAAIGTARLPLLYKGDDSISQRKNHTSANHCD